VTQVSAIPATFVFADIAGFTALTEAHGDEQAVSLVDRFCREVADVLPRYDAEQVKSIGDAVMLRVPSPAAAIELGLHLAHDMLGDHGTPSVRVGMHHGPALCRDGDYFGAAVNLAARVSGLAAGGEVLATASTGSVAGPIDGVLYESRGRHELRGVPEPIEVVAAVREGSPGKAGLAIDPVCHMAVDPDRAAGRLMYEDVAYFFCALECAAAFAGHPERYADQGPRA
jgi:class 3 adenylate cyclase/YHS domain-containing protein